MNATGTSTRSLFATTVISMDSTNGQARICCDVNESEKEKMQSGKELTAAKNIIIFKQEEHLDKHTYMRTHTQQHWEKTKPITRTCPAAYNHINKHIRVQTHTQTHARTHIHTPAQRIAIWKRANTARGFCSQNTQISPAAPAPLAVSSGCFPMLLLPIIS